MVDSLAPTVSDQAAGEVSPLIRFVTKSTWETEGSEALSESV